MSLVRILTSGDTIIRRTGGRKYIFKPLLPEDYESLPAEVIKETEELNDILDKVLDLDSNVKPLESTDTTLVDIINKVMTESDTTDESILNAINTEWSNP